MAVVFVWGVVIGIGMFLIGLFRMMGAAAGGKDCTTQILDVLETDYPYNGDTNKIKYVYSVAVVCKGERIQTKYETVLDSSDTDPLEKGTVLKMRYNKNSDKLYDVSRFRKQTVLGAAIAIISATALLVTAVLVTA